MRVKVLVDEGEFKGMGNVVVVIMLSGWGVGVG